MFYAEIFSKYSRLVVPFSGCVVFMYVLRKFWKKEVIDFIIRRKFHRLSFGVFEAIVWYVTGT